MFQFSWLFLIIIALYIFNRKALASLLFITCMILIMIVTPYLVMRNNANKLYEKYKFKPFAACTDPVRTAKAMWKGGNLY